MNEGVLYVEILPSTKGIQKAVQGDLNTAFKGGEASGKSFFGKVGGWIKGAAVAVGAIGVAVGGIALAGGISRALNIEDAQAKLKGLGHDTEAVEAIMTDALNSVKGTAFGLDSAATVAASAVAAGIQPGKELESYLRLTADAAVIAGTSMQEMGDIINKVTSKGTAGMENLNQLTERGIPIMQWLADEYGVTADELSDMVSRGEVDAATFRKVIEDNIGGAALSAGDTTRGAFANMMAALSRLGEAFAGPGIGVAKTLFDEITIAVDGVTERLQPLADKFATFLDGLNIEGAGQNFLDFLDGFSAGPLSKLLDTLQPLIGAVRDLYSAIGGELLGVLSDVASAIAPLLPMLGGALVDAVVALVPSVGDLILALLPLLPVIADLVVALVPPLVEILNTLVPVIIAVVEAVIPLVEWLAELTASEWSAAADPGGWEAFLNILLKLMGPMGMIMQLAMDLGIAIGQGVGGALSAVQSFFFDTFTAAQEIVSGFVTVFQDAWANLGLFLGDILKAIVALIQGDGSQMVALISGIGAQISGLFQAAWNAVVSWVTTAWTNITSSVQSGVNSAITTVQSLPDRIMSALSGAASWLFSVGQDIIRGLIDGVGSMINNAVQSVQDVGGAMLDGVKDWLGIKSPSRVFRDQVGKMIGEGLIAGVDSMRPEVAASVQALVAIPSVPDEIPTASSSSQTFNIYPRDQDERLIAAAIGRRISTGVA